MHEHDSIHELHARFITGSNNLLHFSHINTTGFFRKHVLAGFGGLDDPLLAHSSRQGDVHCINIIACEEFIIAFHRLRFGGERDVTGTVINPCLRLGLVPAGHRHNLAVA